VCQRKRHHNIWYVQAIFGNPSYSVNLRSEKNLADSKKCFGKNICTKIGYEIEAQQIMLRNTYGDYFMEIIGCNFL
jgi:hypothetical protein